MVHFHLPRPSAVIQSSLGGHSFESPNLLPIFLDSLMRGLVVSDRFRGEKMRLSIKQVEALSKVFIDFGKIIFAALVVVVSYQRTLSS